ncbi:MAG: hypothetical protein ACYCTE_10110 [Acidimicrobiales bacterium]
MTFEATWSDSSGKRHTANFATAADADAYRQERLRERRHGGTGDPSGGKTTVGEWWERWSATRQVLSSTRAREQSIWRCQVEPRVGSTRLADLRRSDIAAWTVSMSGELAPATVTRCWVTLKKLLTDAVSEGLIAASPAAAVAPPPYGVRELATAGGLAVSYVSRVLDTLNDEVLVERSERGRVEAVDIGRLIRRWGENYDVFRANKAQRYLAPAGAATALDQLRAVETQTDPVAWERTSLVDDVTYVAPSQAAADCLTGNGRMPAEGEALLQWMTENESLWRLDKLPARGVDG